jgi:hypothetical protein
MNNEQTSAGGECESGTFTPALSGAVLVRLASQLQYSRVPLASAVRPACGRHCLACAQEHSGTPARRPPAARQPPATLAAPHSNLRQLAPSGRAAKLLRKEPGVPWWPNTTLELQHLAVER